MDRILPEKKKKELGSKFFFKASRWGLSFVNILILALWCHDQRPSHALLNLWLIVLWANKWVLFQVVKFVVACCTAVWKINMDFSIWKWNATVTDTSKYRNLFGIGKQGEIGRILRSMIEKRLECLEQTISINRNIGV